MGIEYVLSIIAIWIGSSFTTLPQPAQHSALRLGLHTHNNNLLAWSDNTAYDDFENATCHNCFWRDLNWRVIRAYRKYLHDVINFNVVKFKKLISNSKKPPFPDIPEPITFQRWRTCLALIVNHRTLIAGLPFD